MFKRAHRSSRLLGQAAVLVLVSSWGCYGRAPVSACVLHSDCEALHYCAASACLQDCRVDTDCPLGQICTAVGQCVGPGYAGPAVRLRDSGGNRQRGRPGQTLGRFFEVRAENSSGEGIAQVDVTFRVVEGGGSLSSSQPVTSDAFGRARTLFTLGDNPGSNRVTASANGLDGSPITFEALAVVPV